MKAVIFAGGLGTRFSEKTQYMPKPMIEIGGKPILWHIMKIYSAYGINDFVICAGYKQNDSSPIYLRMRFSRPAVMVDNPVSTIVTFQFSE